MAILKHFKCKGSIGLHYGLGQEEVAVNFDNLSGLVTLAGNNGNGKTTFMELLSPFDVMPSRKLKNPRKYNLKNQFMLRDSYKEVCYIFNGEEYKFRVEIPAGTTMGIEGYITRDGVPLVKGKISEYRKMVVELFGSEELFYSSIFSCQGGPKLTDRTVGEFKQLLIELLGLNKYVEWWYSIGKVQKAVKVKLDKVLSDVSLHDGDIKAMEKNQELLEQSEFSLMMDQNKIVAIKKEIATVEEDLKTLQAQKVEAEKNEAVITEKKKAIEDLKTNYHAVLAESGDKIASYNLFKANTEKEIEEYTGLVSKEADILEASDKIKGLEKAKQDLEATICDLNTSIEEKQAFYNKIAIEIQGLYKKQGAIREESDLETLDNRVSELEAELTKAETSLAEKERLLLIAKDPSPLQALLTTLSQYQDAEDLLETRPAKCTIDDCPFIMAAIASIKQKPETEKAITAWKKANKIVVDNAEKEVLAAQAVVSTLLVEKSEAMSAWSTESERVKGMLEVVKEGIDTNEKTNRELSILVDEQKTKKDKSASLIAGIDGHIKTFQELSGKAPELEAAKQTITALKKGISDKWIEVAAEIKALETKSNGLMDKIKTIEAEIKALPAVNEDLDDLIITQQNELNGLDSELTSVNLAASNLDKKIAVLEDKIASAEETKAVVEGLKKEERHIRKELSRWDYIRGAVSKSGLQALEIASAAPLLTGIANDLLTDAFGGSFFLDLVTEDPETGAEILDIYVTREDGKTYSLSEFSGGESVYILQAMKCAQIVVNIEKSGVHFQTAFADEECSSLDKGKSEKFIKLYRALLKRAGFEKLIYITHIPEAQALSDYVIDFTKEGLKSESDI